ncbi:hypothetical protein HDV02_001857 [Globomyces sp. JEL0801]|nr:hypothetical protein HDV02_001857 [Globomyces sp. JEL0801]
MQMTATSTKGICAFVTLVCIQVTVGLVYKLASNGEKGYEFSRASALAISEGFKLLISSIFFFNSFEECSPMTIIERIKNAKEKLIDDVPVDSYTAKGMIGLSAIYLFNNHLSFCLVDPGTINLVKSGSTFFTAIVLWIGFGRVSTQSKWVAIVIQLFALVMSQYDECNASSTYSVSLYFLICFSTILSSISGSLNDHFSKSSGASLHALNIYLYSSGLLFNLVYFVLRQLFSSSEPAFFDGFWGWGLGVIICNSFIGLAITAYADAVMKCLAQSISTSLLLILSLALFGTPVRLTSGAGCIIVFLTTYLYLTDTQPVTTEECEKFVQPDVECQEKPYTSTVRALV